MIRAWMDEGRAVSPPAPAITNRPAEPADDQRSITLPFPDGLARVVSLAEVQSLPKWKEAFAGKCKDHRYYEIVDETLESKFQHHYLVLEDKTGQVRAIQPVFFLNQNLLDGIPGLKAAVDRIQQRFPRFLTMRVLMVGNVAGEGHLSPSRQEDQAWLVTALEAILKTYAKLAGASLIVFKDFPSSYRKVLHKLRTNKYSRVPSMPMTELQLPYADFEQYLRTLGASTRKDLRRKFRKIAKVSPIELEVMTDITPVVEEVYPLYLQVHERSPLKFERLTKAYLSQLGQRMSDRVRFFIWRQNGKAIAFSITLVHGGTIYDDYLGLDYSIALDLHLYFYTLRDIISWSLEQGLKRYRSSPLNYRPKLHLGCDLFPLDLYVMHTAGWLNPIISQALRFLEPTRHDPVLKHFRNADELHPDAK